MLRQYLFLTACAVLTALPPLFIWNRVYKDGIIGRAFLGGISACAALFLLDPWFGDAKYDVPPLAVALAWSVAGFLCWHLYRFHTRVFRHTGVCPPDCPHDRRKVPDRRFVSS